MEEKPKELPEKTDNKRNLKTGEIQKNLYFPRFLALQEIAFVKPKTLREDVTRCKRNMSAKADCIWHEKRNKSLKD